MHRDYMQHLAFILLLALPALAGCDKAEASNEQAEPVKRAVTVEAAPARIAVIPDLVRFSATAMPTAVIGVSSLLPGKIARILAAEGRTVEAGDVLFELDDVDTKLGVKQAEKALASAEARLEQLRLAAEIERDSLELGAQQAEAALKQVQARAKMVERGARPEEKGQVAAMVEMARTQMEAMEREADRMRGLYKEEVIPKQRLEQLEDSYKVSQAQFRQASAQLRLVNLGARDEDREAMAAAVDQVEHAVKLARVALKQAEARKLDIKATELAIEQANVGLEMARLADSRTVVLSPCRGLVDSVTAEVGMVVAPGLPMVMVVPSDKLELVAMLQQEDVVRVKPGMVASYLADGVTGQEPMSGKVIHVGAMANPMTGAFPVKIEAEPGDARKLKGGMYVTGEIVAGSKPGSLLVPAQAVLRREGGKMLFTVEGKLAKMARVETGLKLGDELEITSGLQAGLPVVFHGQVGLLDGVEVEIAEGEPKP